MSGQRWAAAIRLDSCGPCPMLRRNQHAGGHAAKREADSHHAHRQPAAPAGADQALCETCARRAGRYGRACSSRQGRHERHRGETGRGRRRHRQQRRAAARLVHLLHPRPPDRARRLVAAQAARRRRALPDLQERILRGLAAAGIRGRHPRPAKGDRRDRLSGCQRREGRMRGFPRHAGCDRQPVRRAVPHRALARHGVGDREERALQDRRGVSRRARQRAAPRIQGDRRRRLPAPARLPGSRAREAQHVRGPAARRLHRVRQSGGRCDQRGDPRHPAGEGAAACLLGQLRGPARSRRRAAGDHPVPASAPRSAASCCRSPTRATRTSTAT